MCSIGACGTAKSAGEDSSEEREDDGKEDDNDDEEEGTTTLCFIDIFTLTTLETFLRGCIFDSATDRGENETDERSDAARSVRCLHCSNEQ